MSASPQRRSPGRPRIEDSPVSVDDILGAALRAFATHGYDGVTVRTLNRELGVSHNLINGRFGSKEGLWYATVDWAFQSLVQRLATAFDPTLTDPLDQLRITIRTFLLHSAEHPELLGLMNIEGRQDTKRLDYIYDTYIQPASSRPADYSITSPTRGEPTRSPCAPSTSSSPTAPPPPFSLAALARHFDPADPLEPGVVAAHADLAADLLMRAIEIDHPEPSEWTWSSALSVCSS